MRSMRVAEGLYKVPTLDGTWTIERIGREWFVTPPNEWSATDVYETKRDALAAIESTTYNER